MTTTETLLRAAIALLEEAVFIIDVERMDYIEFNEALCVMSGRSREELGRLGPLGVWASTGGSEQALRQHYQQLIKQTPAPIRHLMALHRPDGSFVEVWMKRQALQIDRRWVIVACAQAVSEPEMSRPPQTLESLVSQMNASPDAASLIDYQAMRYIDVNAGACEILGYSRAELLEGDLPLSGDRTIEDLRELYSDVVMHSPQELTEFTSYFRSDGTEVPGKVSRRAVLVDGAWVIYVCVSGYPRNP
jgi:PAS domain S-box-containing protein